MLIFIENFKNYSHGNFIIYKKYPFKGQLLLGGYAQSSVLGELNDILTIILDYSRSTRMRWQESKTIAISRDNVQRKAIWTKND